MSGSTARRFLGAGERRAEWNCCLLNGEGGQINESWADSHGVGESAEETTSNSLVGGCQVSRARRRETVADLLEFRGWYSSSRSESSVIPWYRSRFA